MLKRCAMERARRVAPICLIASLLAVGAGAAEADAAASAAKRCKAGYVKQTTKRAGRKVTRCVRKPSRRTTPAKPKAPVKPAPPVTPAPPAAPATFLIGNYSGPGGFLAAGVAPGAVGLSLLFPESAFYPLGCPAPVHPSLDLKATVARFDINGSTVGATLTTSNASAAGGQLVLGPHTYGTAVTATVTGTVTGPKQIEGSVTVAETQTTDGPQTAHCEKTVAFTVTHP
jgi:hypothetical protein